MRIALGVTIWLCLARTAAAIGCGGDDESSAADKPTSVVAADLDKSGEFWLTLTPDLKDELVDYGKDRLGEERPDGASSIRAVDGDELVSEMDKRYSNEAKRESTIYETYRGANDEIAQDTLDELLPQLEDEGNAP